MNRLVYTMILFSIFIACKPEHPDLKSAHTLFLEARSLKQEILTSKIDVLNQAK
jgi:hypothetical protein